MEQQYECLSCKYCKDCRPLALSLGPKFQCPSKELSASKKTVPEVTQSEKGIKQCYGPAIRFQGRQTVRISHKERLEMLPKGRFVTEDLSGNPATWNSFLNLARDAGEVVSYKKPGSLGLEWERVVKTPASESTKQKSGKRGGLSHEERLASLPAGEFKTKDLPGNKMTWGGFLHKAKKLGEVVGVKTKGRINLTWKRTAIVPAPPAAVPTTKVPEEPAPSKPLDIKLPGKYAKYDERLGSLPFKWFYAKELPGNRKAWNVFLTKAKLKGDVERNGRRWRRVPPAIQPIGRPVGRKNTTYKERFNSLPDEFALEQLPGSKAANMSFINKAVARGDVEKLGTGKDAKYRRVVKKPELKLSYTVEESTNGQRMEDMRKAGLI